MGGRRGTTCRAPRLLGILEGGQFYEIFMPCKMDLAAV